ncbi:MAG: dethiobiotin synthase [Bacteroidales bacterium]|jgi:dethiobiotin synthetase
MKKYFITGIGTDVGKTFISAIFTEALKADYWKPVQAGSLDNTDTDVVKSLVSNSVTKFHPEAYKFKLPASPHKAAIAEGITVNPDKFVLPVTSNSLILEGAGGLMVPLSDNFLMIDLIKKLDTEVILVSMNYLGSINHTLLAAESLKSRNISVKGIVFNGERDEEGEKFILNYTKLKCLLHVNKEECLTKEIVIKYSDILNSSNYF